MKSTEMIERVHQYIKGVSEQDIGAIKQLYDSDAVVEDPVGSEPHVGIDAICAFYEQGFPAKVHLELAGPVRCAGMSAAFPFVCTTNLGDTKMRIDVIDVFEFTKAVRRVPLNSAEKSRCLALVGKWGRLHHGALRRELGQALSYRLKRR